LKNPIDLNPLSAGYTQFSHCC